MPGGQQHGTKQDGHVIAIAGPEFEHPSRRMEQFHSENIARVTDVSFHEVKERTNFTHSVLWIHTGGTKDLDGFLSDIEVFRAVLD